MPNPADRKGLRTWIEIDKKALAHNYGLLKNLVPTKCKFMSVVKSNAYGHGLVDFALEVQKLGADWFGVDSIVEGMTLRSEGITKPILVLGYTLPEMLYKAIELDINITVSTFELLAEIEKSTFTRKIKVHIKVDTGMHRQGFQEKDINQVITSIKKLDSKIEVAGLFTHLAGVKNSAFLDLTKKQFELFNIWIEAFKSNGFNPIIHAEASSGVFVFPEFSFDMVRFGIAQYGLWPSKKIELSLKEKIELKPILEWKTLVGEVKNLPKGDRTGYDFTEEFAKDSTVAVCPIGYWHGYPRSLSSVGIVLVQGKKARVLGRISMDMIVIDVSNIPDAKVGDSVTLIGTDGAEAIFAEEVATYSGTTLYEIVTRINPLIKRLYL